MYAFSNASCTVAGGCDVVSAGFGASAGFASIPLGSVPFGLVVAAGLSAGFAGAGFVSVPLGSVPLGLVSTGFTSTGLVSAGFTSAGLVSAGFTSAGLVSAGFTSTAPQQV